MDTDPCEHPANPSCPPETDLIAEIGATRNAVEELYLLLDHLWRNREELRNILVDLVESGRIEAPGTFPLEDALGMGLTAEQIRAALDAGVTTAVGLRQIEKNTRVASIPESIACALCDTDSPASLAAALQEGWTSLQRDDGQGWNYLGVCPECQAEERAEGDSLKKVEPQGRLFG